MLQSIEVGKKDEGDRKGKVSAVENEDASSSP